MLPLIGPAAGAIDDVSVPEDGMGRRTPFAGTPPASRRTKRSAEAAPHPGHVRRGFFDAARDIRRKGARSAWPGRRRVTVYDLGGVVGGRSLPEVIDEWDV
ncbi:hypothetical protein GCM10010121_082380 [Streptomyces brasiliensis]|uniref:Uncharacterized protein n=2 Tax=Streptomyces brasiliensis TaxID=1954 RepID=A0A917LD16_9ACTN|nr:hypothetical protein GCM10010121_082380 [Streptomyces brasiliensis]